MRVLLYDHDGERNRRLHQHLEDDDIPVIAAYSLKEFLMRFEKPSLKVLLIEQARIRHYNIDVEDILDRLGLTFIVIVYNETDTGFEFTTHYLPIYFCFPFTTQKDKELIKKVKNSLQRFSQYKEDNKRNQSDHITHTACINENAILQSLQYFSEKQKKLMTRLLEKKDGINVQEIIQILNAENVKDEQNYAQSHIYRLRNKLTRLLGQQYIISYKNHTYQLLYIADKV